MGRPKIETIRAKFIEQILLKGNVRIGAYDYRHVFIEFNNEADFNTAYFQRFMGISRALMRMFKWSPDFDPTEETSLAPIWVLLPELPFHMFKWDYLRHVLEQIGTPMKEDIATVSRTRAHMAKVRVEVDLMKPLPDAVFIGIEGDTTGLKGRDQKLEYEGVPAFCRTCKLQGHDVERCKVEARKKEQATTNRENEKTEKRDEQQKANVPRGAELKANTEGAQIHPKNQKDEGFIQVQPKQDQTALQNNNTQNLEAIKGNVEGKQNETTTIQMKETNTNKKSARNKKKKTNKVNTQSLKVKNRLWVKQKSRQIEEKIIEAVQKKGKIQTMSRPKQITLGKGKEIQSQQEGKTKDHESSNASSNNQIMSSFTADTACVQNEGGKITIDLGTIEHIPGELNNKHGPDIDNNSIYESGEDIDSNHSQEASIDDEVAESSREEKKGGTPHVLSKSADFIRCMDDCGMTDLGYTWNPFTWCNGSRGRRRISTRLDRVLINEDWAKKFQINRVDHHAKSGSDHSLITFKFGNENQEAIKYFRFLNFWTKHSDYNSLVESTWNKEVQGNNQWILQQKLKVVARCLSKWSKESIRDVCTSVKLSELEMCRLEQEYEINNNDVNRQNLYKAQAEYTRWLEIQESILKQKARIKWAEEGDSNSKYFHSVIKEKRRRAHIYRIKDEQGIWMEGNEAIAKAAIDHFGRKKICYFADLATKVQNKAGGWQGKLLSSSGKAIIIKHILQSQTLYLLAAMEPPKAIIKQIETYLTNFFWGEKEGKKSYHWCSWDNMSYPTDEGGVGFKKLQDICNSFAAKRWWRFRVENNLWTRFLRAKYCQRSNPISKKLDPKDSNSWRSLLEARNKVDLNIQWKINKGNSLLDTIRNHENNRQSPIKAKKH
ncbi:putative ribonuclease h protein [Nicotiana attenuata]|uniref:Ribonuclease h protein n=1 Tax=Nicotiana attenuata TaxID=49451 RepID=A0A1J6KEA7_NICAT|nr:putative ribonuclease h protein [Nicotiana attenuata]